MNQRLSRHNFIAGYLLILSLAFVITEALRMDIGGGTIIMLSLLIWSMAHYLFGHRHIAKGSALLILSSVLLACGQPINMKWVDYIQVYNQLQWGMSTNLAEVLALDKWPAFAFYFMDALLQGADLMEQVYGFNLLIISILLIVISMVFYSSILDRRHYGFYLIPLFIFVQQWFQYADRIQFNFSLYFIGFIMAAGSYTREKAHRESADAAYGLKHFAAKRYGAYLFVMGFLVIMISNVALFFTPVDRINSAIGETVPNILDMRTGYKRGSMAMFTFKQTMYQPYDERLGGPVERGENPVLLRVWTSKGNAYLRGRVKTKYTGTSWTSDHVLYSNNNDYPSQTGIPLTRSSSYEITVVPEGIMTKTLFAPIGVKEVELDKTKVFVNPDGAMYYKRESLEGPLDIYKIRGVDYSMRLEDREIYLDLPGSFDEKVRQKALEITEDLETDYEKMEALKAWLRESYPYDLSPGLPPGDADFVSYFLFEEQSGYCTYFASAIATMGRAIDIPTRYVEGFILPDTRQPDGSYAVRAERAHAWAEAYIEGEGWRIFEATPAYSGSAGRLNTTLDLETSESGAAGYDDESRFTLDSKEDMLDVEIGEGGTYVPPAESPDYSTEIMYGLLVVLGIASLGVLYMNMRVNSYFEKGSNRQLAVRLIYYLEDLIALEDDAMTPAEKLQKFMETREDQTQAYDIINKVNVVLYGDAEVNSETLALIQQTAFRIEKETKGRLNRLRYWMEHGRSKAKI